MPAKTIPYGDQPAFPAEHVMVETYDTGETKRVAAGVTVRDWFAAQALAGLLARPGSPVPQQFEFEGNVALIAYDLADAMLRAREVR